MPQILRKKLLFFRIMKALYLYLLYFFRVVFPLWRMFFIFRLNLVIPFSSRKKHTYIVAGSGSGKSEFIKVLILSVLSKISGKNSKAETVFLLDPHGDIADEVARFKEHKKEKNLVFLTPNLSPDHQFCINPFDLPDGDQTDENINYMAESLTEVFKQIIRGDSSLSGNMETLLHPVIFALLKKKNTTLKDLQRFMRDDQNQDLVEYAINHSPSGQKHFFQTAFYDPNYIHTKRALYTKLQSLLNSQTFYNLTIGKSTVSIKELMNSGKTVIFNLSKGLIGQATSPTFGKLIVGLVQGYSFQRQKISKADRVPVHLFIDEFHNFITPSIETILAESRKYGIHLTLCQQFHGQGTTAELKNAILNNTAVKIAGTGEGVSLEAVQKFMTGATKEALQNLECGKFYVKAKSNNIFRQTITENKAHVFRVTTSYLGKRHGMKPKDWEKVRKNQLLRFYRPIDGRIPAQQTSPEDIPAPEQENATQKRFRPFLPLSPIRPKLAL